MLIKIGNLIYTLVLIPHVLTYLFKRHLFRYEVERWGEVLRLSVSPRNDVRLFLTLVRDIREFRTLFYYRLGPRYFLLRWLAPGMPTCFLHGSERQNVGRGLVIHHGHSMRLGAKHVGEDVEIWHNVTVGKKQSGGELPTIGNRVKICTGAVVLGDIHIGDDATIGACAVVLKDVPANSVVAGNPARIIRHNGQPCNVAL